MAPPAAAVALLFAAVVAPVAALAPLEPADGTVIIGGWLDTSDSPAGHDSSTSFNSRLDIRAGAFELGQNIPVTVAPSPPYPQNTLLYANLTDLSEHTDATVFLTVYPNQGFDAVTDDDFSKLATQISQITQNTARQVMLRYAPEMNGNWNAYGLKSDAFIASWQKMATAIRAVDASVALVWSPNLDTSGDSYSAYWPGDSYVDWVGMSIYWKGYKADWPWISNKLPPDGYIEQIITGTGSEGGTVNFYNTYAAAKNKPFVISENGAAFHLNYTQTGSAAVTVIDPGPGRAAIQSAYYNTFLFNTTFLNTYPLFKMVNMFEFTKTETESQYLVQRDFRATSDASSLADFKQRVAQLQAAGKLHSANTVSNLQGTGTGSSSATGTSKTSLSGARRNAPSTVGIAAVVGALGAAVLALLAM
ncbi:hypothetical protein HK405_002838 [Cladochytrium tenue]|nr:hypothetical protein HK405_002838 [Cladochytrium tenue]